MKQTQITKATQSVKALVSGLVNKASPDELLSMLSPEFGIHGGLSAERYVRHELSEFEERRYWFGDGDFSIVPVSFEDDLLRFVVTDANDGLIYEDVLGVDADGKLTGNRLPIEVVSKLKFKANGEVVRSAALRVPDAALLTARLDAAGFCELHRPSFADDGFWQIEARVEGDDFLERRIGLRSVIEQGSSHRSVLSAEVLFRGKDHPMFAEMRPSISWAKVSIPQGRLRVWSLAVEFLDGSRDYIEHGFSPVMVFDRPVRKVILTDALDNEWEAEARRL